MVITLAEISEKLHQLLDNRISKESAANWATAVKRSDDYERLVFEPVDCEDKIWDALEFLEGIDLQVSPNVYLHDIIDIQAYMEDNNF